MALLTNVEKGTLVKLFNRGGYVLDFSTPDFNAFTFDSIGEALCHKYGVSKGASLNIYVSEASDESTAKLLIDLFDYYELTHNKEIEGANEYAVMYKKCKPIIDRVKSVLAQTTIPVDKLKDRFSSEYISTQLDLMLKMQEENPTEAIGKSK